MSETPYEDVNEDQAESAGSTAQDYGNLSVEDDSEGTVDPADLAGSAGPDDDGGRENP